MLGRMFANPFAKGAVGFVSVWVATKGMDEAYDYTKESMNKPPDPTEQQKQIASNDKLLKQQDALIKERWETYKQVTDNIFDANQDLQKIKDQTKY